MCRFTIHDTLDTVTHIPGPWTVWAPEHPGFNLASVLVLAGTAGVGRMAPPASTRISARLKRKTIQFCIRFPSGECAIEIGREITLHS